MKYSASSRIICKFFFLLFLFSTQLFFANNFEVWNRESLQLPMGGRLNLTGASEFRYRKKELYFKYYEGGVAWNCSPSMQLHTAYRHSYHKISGKWAVESNPIFDLTFKGGRGSSWSISDRNRVQYRIMGKSLGGKNLWLYRNRLELSFPQKARKRGAIPFIADEFFWQQSSGINQNRLEVGLHIPYRQKTRLDLYYMKQHLKNPQKVWSNRNVLWVSFALIF